MEPLIVVNYPEPLLLEARPIEHEAIPEGEVGIGYFHNDALIARSVVTPDSIEAIHNLLSVPVAVALAATEDQQGNIEGRICLVLPVDEDQLGQDPEEEDDEPWKASVPQPPTELSGGDDPFDQEIDPDSPRVVLLPIGNVVRNVRDRHHPNNPAFDAREMLDNLLAGAGQDAVSKAIDDLLKSI